MHISHQQYLVLSIKGSVAAIEAALTAQHNDGDAAHPDNVAARKATIIENLDGLHRLLEQVEPVLREQNQ